MPRRQIVTRKKAAPRHGSILRMEFEGAVEALAAESGERAGVVTDRITELESEEADIRQLQRRISASQVA